MAPQYKLIYGNAKGRAEPIRLMFKYAKVPFEDARMESEEREKIKHLFPWGQIPVLVVDGVYLAQTKAIGRFLARRFDLIGESEMDAAKCDEILDALDDFLNEVSKTYFGEKDETKKAELIKKLAEETVPKYSKRAEAIIEKNGSGYLVGKKITFVDIFWANFTQMVGAFGLDLSAYPVLKKHQDFILGHPGIKEWVETRPKTNF